MERSDLGMDKIEPLGPKEFRGPLGPGYDVGWFQFDFETPYLVNRTDQCKVKPATLTELDQKYAIVKGAMKTSRTYEEFCRVMSEEYHSLGHTGIGEDCHPDPSSANAANQCGVMCYSACSARDPILYRWHKHLEEITQKWRDTKLPL